MCCCCGRKRRGPQEPKTERAPPTEITFTSYTNSSQSSMESKNDPVARSLGHLLRPSLSGENLPAHSPPDAESTTAGMTSESTRSSLSIPTSEVLEPDQTGNSSNAPEALPSFAAASAGMSSPAPPSIDVKTTFACLKLQLNDTLIAHSFPPSAVSLIRNTITAHWPRGIQREESIDAASGRSFKLKGNPFFNTPASTTSLGETVPTCRLLAALLDALSRAGWVLTLNAGTSSGMRQHKATLVFRHQDPAPAPQTWCVLNVLQVGIMDTLRIIDAPEEMYRELQRELEEARMTQRHGRSFDGVYDIELGRFRCTTDNVDVPELMLIMLRVLDRHGFTVALSIDQAMDHGKPDTWYCCKAQGWSPGLPVFHR